jgi:hypothetical protein
MNAGSLQEVHDYVEALAADLANWYQGRKKWKKRLSAILRALSILLITAGGMVPLVKATWTSGTPATGGFDLGQLGYLLIGLGGAAIAFDRFFGFSSGWIRYVTTELAIQRAIDEFRLDWARLTLQLRGAEPNAEQLDALLQLCRNLAMSVRGQVEQETQSWVLEFHSNLADMEKNLKARADEVKPPMAKAAGAP